MNRHKGTLYNYTKSLDKDREERASKRREGEGESTNKLSKYDHNDEENGKCQ